MLPERYFDHAATTFLHPEVLAAMLPFLTTNGGNAHSLHSWGREAAGAVEHARTQVSEALGAEDPGQIFFTAGATEANNWLAHLWGSEWDFSPFEHSSLFEPAQALGAHMLENQGYQLETQNRRTSIMRVNNETGAVLDFPAIDELHSDLTQAVSNIPVSVAGLQFASVSAHKFGGPKGIGVLFARDPYALEPMLRGGDQEGGLRAGTLNVPGIVGMGAAIELAVRLQPQKQAHLIALRQAFFEGLGKHDRIRVNTPPHQSGHILSISFQGLVGETLVIEADQAGFAISSGAACSSRSTEPSHVLTALGLKPEWLQGTVRVSLGWSNSIESAHALGEFLKRRANALWNPESW